MNGINKVYMEYVLSNAEGVQHYQEEAISDQTMDSFELPFDPNESNLTRLKMFIYANGKVSQEIDLDMFNFLRGKSDLSDTSRLQEKKLADPILKDLDENFFAISRYANTPPATLQYADITERDLLGERPIVATDLKNSGIWGFTGLRKLELTVANLMFDITGASDLEVSGALYWNQIDNTPIEPMFEEASVFEDTSQREKDDSDPNVKRKNVFTIYYNTNRLGETLDNQESASPLYLGRFEVHCKYNGRKLSWGFPVSITLQNPVKNAKKLTNKQPVSIDFGTSATCAAIRDNKKTVLLTISGRDKLLDESQAAKRYENPTNIMVYNWQELRRQWQDENTGMPFLLSKHKGISEEDADYDSGYTVDAIFKNVDDLTGRKKMAAILTDLKNIPSELIDNNGKKFMPLNDIPPAIITVTDELEKEDDSHFNPIKFYGYLLGRAINNPARSQFHTHYLVTYPVKFTGDIKKRLRESLAAGILRSLPQPVREQLNPDKVVEMKYEEPVASVAALIPQQLALGEGKSPTMFAIFDLGGGTLDTAFGILRKARGDEQDEARQSIQIFKTGGNDYSGGERLIHKLAFKIYVDNYDLMHEHNIPFILPKSVQRPAKVNEDHLHKADDEIAISNVHTIVEKIARPLFVYNNADGPIDGHLNEIFGKYNASVFPDGDSSVVSLQSSDGRQIEGLKLNVTGIEDFLKNEIGVIVSEFADELMDTFAKNKEQLVLAYADPDEEPSEEELNAVLLDFNYNYKDVKIFLAGNASKQHYVRETMNRFFPDQIEEIGASSSSDSSAEKHASEQINAKTAVAFGQLKMGQYILDKSVIGLDEDIAPFQYNVGYFDDEDDTFRKVIEKGSNSNVWMRANLLLKDPDMTNLYYTEQFVKNADPYANAETMIAINEELELEDPKKRQLYLRVYKNANNTLEYRLVGRNEEPDSSEEPDPTKLIQIRAN